MMNKEVFVESIKTVVLEGSINSMESLLQDPPGRSPSPKLIEISKWYKSRENEDKEITLKIIRQAIELSVFQFFCVIDGVSAIEGIGKKGTLKLYFEKDNVSTLLNNQNEEYLHNLL